MKISNLIKDAGSEIKKITWPTRNETIKYTLIVIGMSVVVASVLGVFDFVFVKLMEKYIF
jgi:preprotein translocase subunit SecE